MRTIALEEHCLSKGFREVIQSDASSQGGGMQPPPTMTAERQTRLADLDSLRLQDMDASGIDLQVLSDNGPVSMPRAGDEGVRLAQESNDQVAAAVAAHPDRFAGFATLPMTEPEVAADELERAVHSLGLKGALNGLARQTINRKLIEENWDDVLRVAGSLTLGTVNVTELLRALQGGGRLSTLAKAIAELGRISKTLYLLSYIDDPAYRRRILIQLNKGESRHSLTRAHLFRTQRRGAPGLSRGTGRATRRAGVGRQCHRPLEHVIPESSVGGYAGTRHEDVTRGCGTSFSSGL